MSTAPLFSQYPELVAAIDALCGGVAWCITGASAILRDSQNNYYFELTKPRYWRTRDDGRTVVGIGAIGGSIEPAESVLDCLQREAREELGVEIAIESARGTHLVYESSKIDTLYLQERGVPRPLLVTISRNLYRRRLLAEYPILAIATFLARIDDTPALGDLYGLLRVPGERLHQALSAAEPSLVDIAGIPGVQMITQATPPEGALLRPVWTAQTLAVLLQSGHLSHLAQPSRAGSEA